MSDTSLNPQTARMLLDDLLREGYHTERAQRMKADWRTALNSELSLTAAQHRSLANIPPRQARMIGKAIASVLYNGRGEVAVTAATDDGPGRLTVTKASAASNSQALRINIPLIDCTFDADCGNWQCGLG